MKRNAGAPLSVRTIPPSPYSYFFKNLTVFEEQMTWL